MHSFSDSNKVIAQNFSSAGMQYTKGHLKIYWITVHQLSLNINFVFYGSCLWILIPTDVKPVSYCFRVVVCLNSFFRKIQLACSEVSFFTHGDQFAASIWIFIEIWSISNQMNLRHMMFCRTISSVWKLPEVKVKHCGLVPLTQSEAGACDQEIFVENWIGHDR